MGQQAAPLLSNPAYCLKYLLIIIVIPVIKQASGAVACFSAIYIVVINAAEKALP